MIESVQSRVRFFDVFCFRYIVIAYELNPLYVASAHSIHIPLNCLNRSTEDDVQQILQYLL